MNISSRELLVMVLGYNFYQEGRNGFPNEKEEDEFLEKMANRQPLATNNLLYKFAQHYTKEIFALYGDIKNIKIEFPTELNRNEWQDLFEMQTDGKFVWRKDRICNLWYEWHRQQEEPYFQYDLVYLPLWEALLDFIKVKWIKKQDGTFDVSINF